MNKLVRAFHTAKGFITLARDPNRLDAVFHLAEQLSDPEDPGLARMLARPAVREFLARPVEPPLVADLPALRRLPAGTLGRAFADFLDQRGFDPTGLYHSKPGDTDVDRFRLHMEHTHDLWHTVTGFDTDPAGELGVQAVTVAQLGSPLGLLILAAALLNTLVKAQGDADRRMEAITVGWRLGKAARPLFGVPWQELLPLPLTEVRARLGITAEQVREAGLEALPAAA